MAKKEITNVFKIQATGGIATPAPPIGPALGQYGVNPGQFIQQFNAATQNIKGKVVGVVITTYKDRTFTFEIKSSPASALLKEAVKAEKGSGCAGANSRTNHAIRSRPARQELLVNPAHRPRRLLASEVLPHTALRLLGQAAPVVGLIQQ